MKTWTPTSMHSVNLQHPNWSGRAFRTAREAMGFGLEWPGYDTQSRASFDVLVWGTVFLLSLLVVIFLGAATFGDGYGRDHMDVSAHRAQPAVRGEVSNGGAEAARAEPRTAGEGGNS